MTAGLGATKREVEEFLRRGDVVLEEEPPLAAIVVDTAARVLNANAQAEALLGAEAAELRGKSVQEMVPNDPLCALMACALLTPDGVENHVNLPGRGRQLVRAWARDVNDPRVGAVVLFRVVNERSVCRAG